MYKRVNLTYLLERNEKMVLDILNFSVGGYRNIAAAKLDLNKVTAIVGLNGYGKSNVISAIDFGIDFIKTPYKKNMMSHKNEIPLLKDFAGKDYSFEIEARFDGIVFKYGYSFEWKTLLNKPKIKNEFLSIKTESGTNQYNTYIKRDGDYALFKSSPKGRCDNSIEIKDDELVINKLMNRDKLFYSDTIFEINNIEFYIEKHLDSAPSFQPDNVIFKLSGGLDDIKNIPRIIWEIKENNESKYRILKDTFMHIFPSVMDIECREHSITNIGSIDIRDIMFSDNVYTLAVKDDRLTQPISFENLSDGTRRVFLALTFAVLADIKKLSVIVFEEPENSIHPSLLQIFLRALDKLSGNCKIVFTSHSPYMIQYMPLDSVYIGLRCNSGQVDFRRITRPDTLIKHASKHDQTIGDLIFSYLSFNNSNELLSGYIGEPAPGLIHNENDLVFDEDDDWLNDNTENGV